MRNNKVRLLLLILLIASFKKIEAVEKNLIAYWPFDEGKGKITRDLSGNGYTGEIVNTQWTKDAIRGSALRFNGKDSYVLIEIDEDDKNFDLTEVITIEAWIKLDSDANPNKINEIINRSRDRGPGFRLFYGWRSIYFRTGEGYDAPIWEIKTRFLQKNEWHHIVATFDGKFYRMYIDGELRDEREDNRHITLAERGTPITIGAYMGRDTYVFKGIIDEVKIWKRALTEDEILEAVRF